MTDILARGDITPAAGDKPAIRMPPEVARRQVAEAERNEKIDDFAARLSALQNEVAEKHEAAAAKAAQPTTEPATPTPDATTKPTAAEEDALITRAQIIARRPNLTGDETGLPLTPPPGTKKDSSSWPPENEILRAVEASKARDEKPESAPPKRLFRRNQ
jgi:cell division septum initiation protein DivIVA